jgi:transcriptional regulator with XRE-family HTH domain
MAKHRKKSHDLPGVEAAFGHVMRTLREKLGLSQMDLQVTTGLDRTFISDLERGMQCPSLRTVIRVAKGLNIAPGDLVHRTVRSPYFSFPTDEEDL